MSWSDHVTCSCSRSPDFAAACRRSFARSISSTSPVGGNKPCLENSRSLATGLRVSAHQAEALSATAGHDPSLGGRLRRTPAASTSAAPVPLAMAEPERSCDKAAAATKPLCRCCGPRQTHWQWRFRVRPRVSEPGSSLRVQAHRQWQVAQPRAGILAT
jgi:hypothetical protein